MKLLYLSCHSILEYDELSLFNELGVDVFPLGAYIQPDDPGELSMRPGLPQIRLDQRDLAVWNRIDGSGGDRRDRLTPEFVRRFDAVMIMHLPRWIDRNWDAMAGRPVIWRTIGQSTNQTEVALRRYRSNGLKIVRYSPKERTIPGYLGEDALIRFHKDPHEYKGWTGKSRHVVTVNQALPERGVHCNFDLYQQVTRDLPRKLYGPKNEAAGRGVMGKVTFDILKQALRENAVYFYVGTQPASYTLNFIEAWMTGIPLVAVGPKHGNLPLLPDHNLYEIPELIEHGVSGFYSDDPTELREIMQLLLDDGVRGAEVGQAGRGQAIRHFSRESIKLQWADFFHVL